MVYILLVTNQYLVERLNIFLKVCRKILFCKSLVSNYFFRTLSPHKIMFRDKLLLLNTHLLHVLYG